jgi:hypothetical protein
MDRKFSVVTTFHAKGYEQYGKRMIQTFIKNWPKEVTLYVYAENCNVTESAPNVVVRDLIQSSVDLVKFKDTWKNVPKANGDISGVPRLAARKDSHKPFKWDAVRFAHKVYSIFHCAKNCDADVLMWMDADMVCHSPITLTVLNRLVPEEQELCFLGRQGKFSECGLYSMNLRSPMIKTFLGEFQKMYDHAETGIFYLDEWHDSFVFDAVRARMPFIKSLNWSQGIITGEGHPLINTEWGAYIDHLKGDRKSTGKSHLKDLKVKRTEAYWQ